MTDTNWPLLPGHYTVMGTKKPVALCFLGDVESDFKSEQVAIAGKTLCTRFIEDII